MIDTQDRPAEPARPRLRGVIHRYAAVGFALGVMVVVAAAPDGAARAWVAAYGLCVTAMFGVSAVYHSGRLSRAAARVLKRVDHSTILLAIGGSYTGIAGLALNGRERTTVLVLVWLCAAVGVGIRMFWLGAPYPVVAVVYVAVGWIALVEIAALIDALTAAELTLVVAGGVIYTIGAVVYALHRPNPWPDTFGYHEVFHALVTMAAICHLAAVASLVAAR